jgi:hypothetical protein
VRPSIIISSYEEPVPGWTDTLAAGGGITFACTSGLMHYVYSQPSSKIDFIPVDYTVNTILCCSAFSARQKDPLVLVFHSSTSHLNPIRIDTFRNIMMDFTKTNPYYKQFSSPYAAPIGNPLLFKLLIFLTETIPSKSLEIYSKLPKLGSKKLQQQSKMLNRVLKKMMEMQQLFAHFINNGWIYESVQIDKILSVMSPEEKMAFPINVKTIDWQKCIQRFCYGIRRFYIKEDVVGPETSYE